MSERRSTLQRCTTIASFGAFLFAALLAACPANPISGAEEPARAEQSTSTRIPNPTQTPVAPPTAPPAGDLPLGATAGVDEASRALAVRLRAGAYTADTTAAAIQALARSDIATYNKPTSTSPIAAVPGQASSERLLSFQTHALALDAWGGEGLSGADVDAMLPIPDAIHDASAPASAFLAGYVASVDTPGAALSRALMAGQDLTHPEQLQFPLIVLTLFASDLASSGSPTARSGSSGAYTNGAAASLRFSGAGATATLCSDSANFINETIHDLFHLLKVAVPNNAVGAFVATIWNWVVDQGEAFVQTLVNAVTDAVLGTIRWIAGGISVVAQEVASLVPYVVTMSVDPGSPISLGTDTIYGSLTATVGGGDLPDWPDVMKDCAKVAQLPLPSFRGRDEPVTWGAPIDNANGLVSEVRADTVTNSDGQASWLFAAAPDPGAEGGQEQQATMRVPVTIHRKALDDARRAIGNALFGGVPGALRGFVDALFAPFLDPLEKAILALIDTHKEGAFEVLYHGPSPSPSLPLPTLPATEPPTSAWSLLIWPTAQAPMPALAGYSCTGLHGDWRFIIYPGYGPTPIEKVYQISYRNRSSGHIDYHFDVITKEDNPLELILDLSIDLVLDDAASGASPSGTSPTITVEGTSHFKSIDVRSGITVTDVTGTPQDLHAGTPTALIPTTLDRALADHPQLHHPFRSQSIKDCGG